MYAQYMYVLYLVVQVGSIEGRGECDGLGHTQDLLTVFQDAAGCCGRETDQWNFWELPLQDPQQLIICSVD